MRYRLKTDIATFVIQQDPYRQNWDLLVNDFPTDTFATPEEAAEVVHQHRSGYTEWDLAENQNAPADLSGWEQEP